MGSLLILGLILAVSTTVLPAVLKCTFPESIVIGSSVFLSSTAVVVHLMKHKEAETDYGRNIMGVLVAQDVMLGFLLVVMPLLQSSGIMVAYTGVRLIFLLVSFLFASFILKFPVLAGLTYLRKKVKGEVFLLSTIGVLLLYVKLGAVLQQSPELACFVCGVVIAGQKQLSEEVVHTLDSIKQLFGALFFASIGLHIYPSFLYNEGPLLISLTLFLMFFKVVLTFGVVNVVFRKDSRTSMIISVGLGQISEFTFVLASKAKR